MSESLIVFVVLVGIVIVLCVIENDARKKGLKQGWDEASKYFNDGIVVLRKEIKDKKKCETCGYNYSHDGQAGTNCMRDNCRFSTRPRVTWGYSID